MKKTTKTLAVVLVVVVVVLAFISLDGGSSRKQGGESLKVGAILPMSGPAGVLGEGARRGIEAAKRDLKEKGINVTVVYEDSQASPKKGLKAYRKLTTVDDVDVVISMFSRVSVPLISKAKRDKKPLLMTLVTAEGAAERSKFAFRMFSNPETNAKALFDGILKPGEEIGVLYLNDEFGVSVKDRIEELAEENKVEVAISESFSPGAGDVRAQLTKLKQAEIGKLVVIPAVPAEATSIVKEYRELGMKTPLVESTSVLAAAGVRKKIGKEALEGVYTVAFPTQVSSEKSEIKEFYLGYDLLNLLAEATGGKKMEGPEIAEKISSIETYSGKNGNLKVEKNGEINPPLTPVRVVDGGLEKIRGG